MSARTVPPRYREYLGAVLRVDRAKKGKSGDGSDYSDRLLAHRLLQQRHHGRADVGRELGRMDLVKEEPFLERHFGDQP